MIEFDVTESWLKAYPGAVVGRMQVGNITNQPKSPALNMVKTELEADIRARFSTREEILSQPVLQAYQRYYKTFHKNYHVLYQMESIALKGKSIPNVNALVESMFTAELKNMLLTAGHDLQTIEGPVTLDIA